MFKKIAEFFTGKKPEVALEAPYKVDPIPVGTEASVIAVITPVVEAVPGKTKSPAKKTAPVKKAVTKVKSTKT